MNKKGFISFILFATLLFSSSYLFISYTPQPTKNNLLSTQTLQEQNTALKRVLIQSAKKDIQEFNNAQRAIDTAQKAQILVGVKIIDLKTLTTAQRKQLLKMIILNNWDRHLDSYQKNSIYDVSIECRSDPYSSNQGQDTLMSPTSTYKKCKDQIHIISEKNPEDPSLFAEIYEDINLKIGSKTHKSTASSPLAPEVLR